LEVREEETTRSRTRGLRKTTDMDEMRRRRKRERRGSGMVPRENPR